MTDRHEPGRSEVEDALRRSLTEHARRAPDPRALTERLLATPAAAPAPKPVRRRGWTPPLLAAACVAAVVAIVLAAVHLGGGEPRDHHAGGRIVTVHPTPVPLSGSAAANGLPSNQPYASAAADTAAPDSAAPDSAGSAAIDGSTLSGVRIQDLTFTGADHGWALASATCLSGNGGRCTALLRTTDGVTWTGHPNTPFDTPGVDGCPSQLCVTSIRFATDKIGYVFGPDALFLTTDGARSWQRLSGGADALETLDGNVIRVTHTGSCPGCQPVVQTAPNGASDWATRPLPGEASGSGAVVLARTGSAAYLLAPGNIAGGTVAHAVLWTSLDDGTSWRNVGEPCPQSTTGVATQEVDGVAVSTTADGAVVVTCRVRNTGRVFVATATRAGGAFAATRLVPGSDSGGAPEPAVAAASARIVLATSTTTAAGASRLYRTTDGGGTWRQDSVVDLGSGVDFAGFESTTVGRLVTAGGTVVWTTRDAGATWSAVRF